jgi:hypothetical protein
MTHAAARGSPVREAVVLPLLFLTVALLGGFRAGRGGAGMAFLPPPLIALLLALLLVGLLRRAGALAPELLMRPERSPLDNLSGATVLVTLFFATAQLFNLITPERGFLHLMVNVFLVLLLWNTLAARPDRPRLLNSLWVVFGGAFALKYVVLASLYDLNGGLAKRVLTTLLEGITLGALQYEPPAPATGYVAFFAVALYMVGLILLPHHPPIVATLIDRDAHTLALTD